VLLRKNRKVILFALNINTRYRGTAKKSSTSGQKSRRMISSVMSSFHINFGEKAIFGLVHLHGLPGSLNYDPKCIQQAVDTSVRSAIALCEGGATGCLIQTVDKAYSLRGMLDPAQVALVAIITERVKRETGKNFRVGVQIMWNEIEASLGIAKAAGGHYVRANAMFGTSYTPFGIVESRPFEVLEYRSRIQASDIQIIADIHSMHYRTVDPFRSVADIARRVRDFGVEAVAIGDKEEKTTLRLIEQMRKEAPGLPIILAGYTNHENVSRLVRAADGAFVGTCLERDGKWGTPIDVERVRSYMDKVGTLTH
jgi:uncharacterized protein